MAITIPAKLPVQAKFALVLPSMPGPLDAILGGTNGLYAWFCPPLASHAITDTSTATDREYIFPIPRTSADGLRYVFKMPLEAGAVGTADVDVDYADTEDPAVAVWVPLVGTVGFGLVNGFAVHSFQGTLPSTAKMIRYRVTNKSTACRPTHIFVAPDPDQAAAPFAAGGVTTSGFRPYDGTLLGTASNPVTTELVDRCWRNSVAVVQDRWQTVASYLSPILRSAVTAKAPQTWASATGWVTVGRAPCRVPKSGSHTLQVKVLADVTGGATADLVEVTACGGPGGDVSVTLDATNTIETANLIAYTSPSGWLDLRVRIKANSAQSTYLHALTIGWQADANLSPSTRITGGGYQVLASSSLLQTARQAMETRGLGRYGDVAHLVDFQTTGRTSGRLHVAIPRAVQALRLSTWRCTDHDSATAPVASKVRGTVDGSIANAAIAVNVTCPAYGAGLYWDCQTPAAGGSAVLVSGETINAAPAALQDRQLAVTEDLVGSIELVEVQQSAGFCLWVGAATADPTTL